MKIQESRLVESTGRIVAHFRDRYVVRTPAGDRDARLAGKLRHAAAQSEDLPAVGDFVILHESTDAGGAVRIESVLPRRSAIVRRLPGDETRGQVLASNVDVAVIVVALSHRLSVRRIERYLVLAWESGATPLIALSKADLAVDVDAAIAEVRGVAPGVDILALSVVRGDGLAALADRIAPGVTAVLLGSSGVGKSTLVNALLGEVHQRIGATRADGAGRHTTTHRELLELPNGGCIIDTPGLRELELREGDDGVARSFSDVEAIATRCRFADCAHETEPECAVVAAVAEGQLARDRLESWRALRRELAFLARKENVIAADAAKRHAKSLDRLGRARLREKYD